MEFFNKTNLNQMFTQVNSNTYEVIDRKSIDCILEIKENNNIKLVGKGARNFKGYILGCFETYKKEIIKIENMKNHIVSIFENIVLLSDKVDISQCKCYFEKYEDNKLYCTIFNLQYNNNKIGYIVINEDLRVIENSNRKNTLEFVEKFNRYINKCEGVEVIEEIAIEEIQESEEVETIEQLEVKIKTIQDCKKANDNNINILFNTIDKINVKLKTPSLTNEEIENLTTNKKELYRIIDEMELKEDEYNKLINSYCSKINNIKKEKIIKDYGNNKYKIIIRDINKIILNIVYTNDLKQIEEYKLIINKNILIMKIHFFNNEIVQFNIYEYEINYKNSNLNYKIEYFYKLSDKGYKTIAEKSTLYNMDGNIINNGIREIEYFDNYYYRHNEYIIINNQNTYNHIKFNKKENEDFTICNLTTSNHLKNKLNYIDFKNLSDNIIKKLEKENKENKNYQYNIDKIKEILFT